MKQFVSLFVFALLVCSTTLAQEQTRATGSVNSQTQTQAEAANDASSLAAGTRLSAELLSTLDAKQANPGDQFRMRTLKPVVVNGKQIVAKGAVLVGHVVEATRAKGKEDVSQLKLRFDQLRNKNLTQPFSATIEQITQATVNHQAQLEGMNSDLGLAGTSNSQTSAAGRASGNTGGLLGGVTNTVGGTVGSTVGGVVGATSGTVNNTVGSVTTTTQQTAGGLLGASAETLNSTAGRTTGLIAISSDTNAETSSSSMLTLTGRNVKVEKGAIFRLRTDKALNIAADRQRQ
jgi:hypothetical protein